MLNAFRQPIDAVLYGMNDRCGPVHTDTYCTGFQEGDQRWKMRAYQMPSLFCASIAVLVLLTAIGAPSAYAQVGSTSSMTSTDPGQFSELPHSDHSQAAYQSGFQHGVIDGNRSSSATSYIDQPKHGFAWHTSEFVKGYVNGYCSIPTNKDVGTDDDRAAFYCPDGPKSAKWFIGKHEPITEGVVVVTYGIPSAGVNVTYQYDDKTSGSSGSETTMVKENGTMHFLGSTAELVGFYPGDKVTVSVSQCITQLNAYGYPECISQPILDNKTITLGETGGIVSFDLSKSAKGLVLSAPEAPPGPEPTGVPSDYIPPPIYGPETTPKYQPSSPLGLYDPTQARNIPIPDPQFTPDTSGLVTKHTAVLSPQNPAPPTLPSRFTKGTVARAQVDYQLGANCNGPYCCFRGLTCAGKIGSACTTLSGTPTMTQQEAAKKALRTEFLNHNNCNKPLLQSRFPQATLQSRFKANAGYGDAAPIFCQLVPEGSI